jgi:hypothetical protein
MLKSSQETKIFPSQKIDSDQLQHILNDDIWAIIFSFLPFNSQILLSSTSKQLTSLFLNLPISLPLKLAIEMKNTTNKYTMENEKLEWLQEIFWPLKCVMRRLKREKMKLIILEKLSQNPTTQNLHKEMSDVKLVEDCTSDPISGGIVQWDNEILEFTIRDAVEFGVVSLNTVRKRYDGDVTCYARRNGKDLTYEEMCLILEEELKIERNAIYEVIKLLASMEWIRGFNMKRSLATLFDAK